jgi:hypothetical protein
MKLTTERLLLADPPTGGICANYNQRLQRSFGAVYYHSVTQHYYDFVVQREISKLQSMVSDLRFSLQ